MKIIALVVFIAIGVLLLSACAAPSTAPEKYGEVNGWRENGLRFP